MYYVSFNYFFLLHFSITDCTWRGLYTRHILVFISLQKILKSLFEYEWIIVLGWHVSM